MSDITLAQARSVVNAARERSAEIDAAMQVLTDTEADPQAFGAFLDLLCHAYDQQLGGLDING